MTDPYKPPAAELTQSQDEADEYPADAGVFVSGPSPFWPKYLFDLFFRPTRFFRQRLALARTNYLIITVWLVGMSSVIDRIESRISTAELNADTDPWERFALIVANWSNLWITVSAGGIIAGLLTWWLWGWWCRIRVKWSGAIEPHPTIARLVLIYSSLVFAIPTLLGLAYSTAVYPSYRIAYEQELAFTIVALIALFWSVATMYKGVTALFKVRQGTAILWFIVFPALFYFIAIGGVGFLFYLKA